jgi:hypothetical protein
VPARRTKTDVLGRYSPAAGAGDHRTDCIAPPSEVVKAFCSTSPRRLGKRSPVSRVCQSSTSDCQLWADDGYPEVMLRNKLFNDAGPKSSSGRSPLMSPKPVFWIVSGSSTNRTGQVREVANDPTGWRKMERAPSFCLLFPRAVGCACLCD